MPSVLEKAKSLLAARKYKELDKVLLQFPKSMHRQRLEINLARLSAEGAEPVVLEPVFDEYMETCREDVSANNLLLAANCKLHVKKWFEASDIANRILSLGTASVSDDQVLLAYEAILLAAYNLRQFDGARKAVDKLKSIQPGKIKWLEWDIVIANAEDQPGLVLSSWHALIEKGVPGDLGHTPKVFSSVLRAFLAFDLLTEAEALITEFRLEEMSEPSVHLALSAFHNFRGDIKRAEATLDSVLEDFPDLPEAKWNKSLYQLAAGDLEQGWLNYEARWRWDNFSSPMRWFDSPRWSGKEDLNGKHLLVWSEQGVSDQLRFLVLLANLLDEFPKVSITIEIDPRLVSICAKWYPEATVRPHSVIDSRGRRDFDLFDFNIPSGSLGQIYFNSVEQIQRSKFRAMGVPVDLKQRVLGALHERGLKKVIGFSWRSALMTNERASHYFPVEKFISVFDEVPDGVGLLSLQYDIQGSERKFLEQFPNVFVPEVNFLDDIAAHSVYVGSCDFVVTCRTIVATLAGMHAVPTVSWMKVEDPGLLGQDTYPWFPNRFNILTRPGFDKGDLHRRLAAITKKYSASDGFLN